MTPPTGQTAAVTVPLSAQDRARPNVRLLGLLAVGHLVIVTNQGALPALLPFLKTAFNLSYASAGAIMLMSTLTSSIIQPLFGRRA